MTAAELAAQWRARGYSVEPEFRRASNKIAVATLAFCRQKITERIYAKPIPNRPRSGKPTWKRTGALRRGERVEIPTAYRVDVVNDVVYAEPRHEAGKPGRRKTRFPAHWRDEWKEEFRPRVQAAYREAALRIMQQGGV